jgi:hypothetical protein
MFKHFSILPYTFNQYGVGGELEKIVFLHLFIRIRYLHHLRQPSSMPSRCPCMPALSA